MATTIEYEKAEEKNRIKRFSFGGKSNLCKSAKSLPKFDENSIRRLVGLELIVIHLYKRLV